MSGAGSGPAIPGTRMDVAPATATLQVGVPFPEAQARERVLKVFQHSQDVLEASLFYRDLSELHIGLLDSFVSAYRGLRPFAVIVHFQQEENEENHTMSVFDIQVEPGKGVNLRQATDEVWRRIFQAAPLSNFQLRPQLKEATIKGGGLDILKGEPASVVRMIRSSSELRVPILVGIIAAVLLIAAIAIGILPANQIP